MEDIKTSLAQLAKTFNERMDTYESSLHKHTASPSTVSPDEDFKVFRATMVAALRTLQMQVDVLACNIDNIEMRSRRKILLLHGVVEEQNEDSVDVTVRVVRDRLKLSSFASTDISRCQRLGRLSSNQPRPILFKLSDVALRGKIWASKSVLKGTGVTISEFLTKTRHDLFLAARQRFGVSKCWTKDGTIYVLGGDGKRNRIRHIEELESVVLPRSESNTKPAPSQTTKANVASTSTKSRRAPVKKS